MSDIETLKSALRDAISMLGEATLNNRRLTSRVRALTEEVTRLREKILGEKRESKVVPAPAGL